MKIAFQVMSMEEKKFLPNVTVKSESSPSTAKKILLSSSPFAHLANKTIHNARLASFKPPRDLLLTGSATVSTNATYNINNSTTKSTKRTFTPNLNVTRKKGNSETLKSDSGSDFSQKLKREKEKKLSSTKKKNANFLQTMGVFSEGLAPGKIKAFSSIVSEKACNERQVLDKPKLNLNKKIIKSDEDIKLKSLLKDNFVDDPNLVPDINFIPSSLPIVYNVKKSENSDDLEKTFETLQVKNEKISSINIHDLKNETPDITTMFENGKDPKLFIFEFPYLHQPKDELFEKKKVSKGQPNESENQSDNSDRLSTLGEGFLGYLRIHENGKTCLVLGKTLIPLSVTRHGTRQELMSASVDSETSKGEVISLGSVDASFTCSANFFQGVS